MASSARSNDPEIRMRLAMILPDSRWNSNSMAARISSMWALAHAGQGTNLDTSFAAPAFCGNLGSPLDGLIQIFAFEKVSPFTIETFTAGHRSACGSPLAVLEPSHAGAALNDLTRKFVTRGEGEPWSELAFVDVEVCAADTASVNAKKNFVGLDFWNSNIPILEFTRSIVNNGFHNNV